MSSSPQFTEHWMRSRHVVSSFVCSMIRDQFAAEDVLQKVAIAAATNFDQYDPERPFAGWLIGIAKRQIAQHYREQGRDLLTFDNQLTEQIAQAHVEVADELADRITALNICMGKLNKRGLEIIDLRYQQNLKPAKIADRVGTTSTAITSLLHRVRMKLRECIELELKRSGVKR